MLYREAGQFKTTYAQDMAMFPIRQDRVALVHSAGGRLRRRAAAGEISHLAVRQRIPAARNLVPFLILSLAAIGVNILVGYCGQISLGSGAFMAVGAYSAYKFGTGMQSRWLLGFNISIPAAAGAAVDPARRADVGVRRHPVRHAELRIKGLYLAVATLAAQFFFDWVFLRVPWFTN